MAFYFKKQPKPFINIVSLIDILVLLLIFFIVTTTFQREEPVVKIQLPESKQSGSTQLKEPIIVYVTQDDEIFLGKEIVSVDELTAKLKSLANRANSLALKADEKANFGLIIKVLDALKEVGIEKVPAFTQPVKTK